jgi:hypothetical protein
MSTPADQGIKAAKQDNAAVRRGLRIAAERRAAADQKQIPAARADEPFLQPAQTGGPLDPLNVWGPGELDRWAAAAIGQQRQLVQQAIRLLDKKEFELLHRTLLLQRHWFGVSERIQQLREEMKR